MMEDNFLKDFETREGQIQAGQQKYDRRFQLVKLQIDRIVELC